MAPPASAAQNLQVNRPRPTYRPIVPAIPLPYIQKRKQTAAAQTRVEERKVAEEPAQASVAITPQPASPVPGSKTVVISNGTSDVGDDSVAGVAGLEPVNNGIEGSETLGTATHGGPETSQTDDGLEPKSGASDALKSPKSTGTSGLKSSAPRAVYDMPPPFVPTEHIQSPPIVESANFYKQPQFPPHPAHHNNPSVGSLVFGGHTESDNASSAPPVSAGLPLGPLPVSDALDGIRSNGQQTNGGHPHVLPNGDSSMAPSGPPDHFSRQDSHVHQSFGSDGLPRRHLVSFVPSTEPFGSPAFPTGNENGRHPHHDPSTSQSFHGSQSSIPNDHDSSGPIFYNPYPIHVLPNGHIDDLRNHQQPRMNGRSGSQSAGTQGHHPHGSMSQPPMLPPMDNLDGLWTYLQAQFADPEFADYTLELRYSDDRAAPVRIPGHNLLFARSPALKKLIVAQTQQANDDTVGTTSLFIESDDRFLRSDAFWLAVQRLYGAPLLSPGTSASIPASSQPPSGMPGTPADRFDLALGYAAAGHILQMPPVVHRGIDMASHFVNWQTVERALDFGLDGGLDSQWTLEISHKSISPSTYGPEVNMLIHSCLNFLVASFPPNFELDATATEPTHNRRIPSVPEAHHSTPSSRFSGIKFGDHGMEEDSTPTQHLKNGWTMILSRILLNLPFQLLKYVLESPRLGNVSGWATAALRQKVMYAVIEEREKRRTKARDTRLVSNEEREAKRKVWEAVGWKESVGTIGNGGESSVLGREFEGFKMPEI